MSTEPSYGGGAMKRNDRFKVVDQVIIQIFKWICIVTFAAIMVLVTANVLLRYIPITSINWYSEIVELCFAWMIFYGAAAVWIARGHFSAGDWIGKRLKKPRVRATYHLLVEIISFVFIAIFFWYSRELFNRSIEVTESLQFPKKVIYSCMPISSAVMVLYSIKFLILGIIDIVKPEKVEEKAKQA